MLEDRDYMRRPSSDWRMHWSATLILVVANVAVFVLGEIYRNIHPFGFTKLLAWLALSPEGLLHGFVWQVLTFQFLHSSLGHLVCNMIGLFTVGRVLEQFLGSRGFALLYLASGTIGGLLQALLGIFLPDRMGGIVVGASAGVFGIVAAFARLQPEARLLLMFFFPIKARSLLWIVTALAVALSFVPMEPRVAHVAHLGGILTGVTWIGLGWHQDYMAWPWENWWTNWRRWRPLENHQRKRELVRAASVRSEQRGRPTRLPPSELPTEEFISKEVDPILDKIHAHGIQSLSERERRILEIAQKKMTGQ